MYQNDSSCLSNPSSKPPFPFPVLEEVEGWKFLQSQIESGTNLASLVSGAQRPYYEDFRSIKAHLCWFNTVLEQIQCHQSPPGPCFSSELQKATSVTSLPHRSPSRWSVAQGQRQQRSRAPSRPSGKWFWRPPSSSDQGLTPLQFEKLKMKYFWNIWCECVLDNVTNVKCHVFSGALKWYLLSCTVQRHKIWSKRSVRVW